MKIFTLGGTILALAVAFVAASPSVRADESDKGSSAAPENPAEVIASHVREQGHRCDKPQTAQREVALSRPDEAVWLLECENATYRITLIPHMASRVERVSSR